MVQEVYVREKIEEKVRGELREGKKVLRLGQ
jgi:hypothetical protein